MPDIRDQPSIDQADVMALNFINRTAPVVFRKHYRQGLRSHIMEILDPAAVALEQSGVLRDGVRWFPKARPRRMFRIFRARLKTLDRALSEIGRVKIVERYLAPDFMATSLECIVDYRGPGGERDLMLCGFQEYVSGEVLDPWTILDSDQLLTGLYGQLNRDDNAASLPLHQWVGTVHQRSRRFVKQIKRMIQDAGHVPDLAGAGNLILTGSGAVRLVDINNISRVDYGASIELDEKGYPVCDKSIEALALIEEKLGGRQIDKREKWYRHFLDPRRWEAVKAEENRFWQDRATD
jgi:hypothetical protein